MTWMLTATGQQIDLMNLDTDELSVREIAHHLAQINRFTGACVRPYSVAEHSLLVAEILEREAGVRSPEVLLAGLMHDAHEALLNDVSTPLKQAMAALAAADGREASDWQRIEDRHAERLRQRFGLERIFETRGALLRWADLVALSTEWAYLMPCTAPVPECWTTHPAVGWVNLRDRDGMDWTDWAQAFCDRFDELHMGRTVQ